MMYVKLAIRNLKRSTKEYAVYVMTLVIAVMLMYAFNGMALSKEVSNLSSLMESMMGGVIIASVFIVLVMGWLIYYISNFILQKRSKEFGMYMLMGMTRRQVSLMFFMEQICMGLIAFVLGCALGVFAYQIIEAIIMNVFQKGYHFSVTFSGKAAGITALYFIAIYVFELLREFRYLKKQRIHDLLYNDRKNQKHTYRAFISILCFVLSIIGFVYGLIALNLSLNEIQTGANMMLSILSFAISIFLLYFGLSHVVLGVLKKNKKIKYKGNMLYLSKQLCTKMQTNRMVLSLLTILTLVSLVMVCFSLKFNEAQSQSLSLVPYDLIASSTNDIDTEDIKAYMDKHNISYVDHRYAWYGLPYDAREVVKGLPMQNFYKVASDFQYLRYSDYAKLMQMLNQKPISLKHDEYLIIAPWDLKKEIYTNAKSYTFQGMHLKAVDDREIGQSRSAELLFVIPDNALPDDARAQYYLYALKSDEPSNEDWREIQKPFIQKNEYSSILIKDIWIREGLSSSMIITFCLIYLAIIFTCVNATVLAVQQMSDVWKQKKSYRMLWKMGIEKRDIYAMLRKQIALYFMIPFIISVIYVFPIIKVINQLFAQSFSRTSMIPYVWIALLFYSMIELCYFLLAYFSSKRSISE